MSDWRAVTVVTGPATVPVSVSDMKDHLRVSGSDDDDYIADLIASAVAAMEGPNGYGLAMITQTWRVVFDCFPYAPVGRHAVLRLPGGPVASITSVNYVDTDGADQVIDSSLYRADLKREPVRVAPVNSWPNEDDVIGAVWVDYVVGGAEVDAGLKHALRMLVAHWYENREAVVVDVSAMSVPLGFDDIMGGHRRGFAA